MEYSYRRVVQRPFADVVTAIKKALATEGFGIITEIDVKATMKKKLNVEYDDYVILGACNPDFAHTALLAEKEIGLLLPCNVIVYQADSTVVVSAIKPSVAMQMINSDKLADLAEQVEVALQRAVDTF